MKKQAIIAILAIPILLGLGWFFLSKKEVKNPAPSDATEVATTIRTTTDQISSAANIYSQKSSETKIKPGVIKNDIYETETFILAIPEDWKLVQLKELPFSDVHASNIDAIFQLGDQQCYEIFTASTTLVTAPVGSTGIRVIDDFILAATGYGETRSPFETPHPSRMTWVYDGLPEGGPTILFEGNLNDSWANLGCERSFYNALAENMKFKIPAQVMTTLEGHTGEQLDVNQSAEFSPGNEAISAFILTSKDGRRKFFFAIPSYIQNERVLRLSPVVSGSKLFWVDPKDWYLKSADLWSGEAETIPLSGTAVKRTNIPPGHNTIHDFIVYQNIVWYLADEPCAGWQNGMQCNVELRSFNLTTRKDTHLAYAQAQEILGIDPKENSLYASKYLGSLLQCIPATGDVVKINLATGALDEFIKSECAPNLSGHAPDAEERKEALQQKLESISPHVDTFIVGNHSLTPIVRPDTSSNAIRFIAD